MSTRAKIIWAISTLIGLSALCLWAGGSFPTQGSGAADLIRISAKPELPPMPLVGEIPIRTQAWYFAATAISGYGLESDYSNEVVFRSTNSRPLITLAWDPSPSPDISQYRIYIGPASATYTNSRTAGTNTSMSIQLGPPLLTNVLLVVQTTNATNLLRATSLRGPWIRLGITNVVLTNPVSPLFFRGMGRKPNRVTIKATRF